MLASLDDLADRIPNAEYDDDKAVGLLTEASVLVEGYLQRTFTNPVPEAVRIVVSRMAARVIEAPKEIAFQESTALTAGPFSHSTTYAGGGSGGAPWLTTSDKTMLAPFKKRKRRLLSITMQ